MKSLFLVVLLAAAATAAVVSNEVVKVVEVPERVEGDDVADVDVNELPEVVELTDDTFPGVSPRRDLFLGINSFTDTLVYNQEVREEGIAGRVLTREIRVNTFGTITAIRATQLGPNQNPTPSVVSGGVFQCCVTIRIRTVTGGGYRYRVQVYAR